MIFVMGIFPNFFLSRIEPSVKSYLNKNIEKSLVQTSNKLDLKISKKQKRSKR